MNTLILYLLKVSVSIALFYGLHLIFLKRDTFFKLRRFYFLFAILFSLLFPFISIKDVWGNSPSINNVKQLFYQMEDVIFTANDTTVDNLFHWGYLLYIIAGLGTVFLLSKLLIELFSLYQKLYSCRFLLSENNVIQCNDDTPTFSFFHWIVLNARNKSEEQINDVLSHEQVHVSQFHTIDILLLELLTALLWWNPFIWLLKHEVKLNLEFLADDGASSKAKNVKKYQYLLLQTSAANLSYTITNNLNISQLKKRIDMMNKKRTSTINKWKFFLFIPLSILLIQCNSKVEQQTEREVSIVKSEEIAVKEDFDKEELKADDNPLLIVEEMPSFPGGDQEMQKFIIKNLQYPKEAEKNGIQGRVTIQFVVNTNGDVAEPIILRGIGPDCDEEALRVVKSMPKWTPGKQNGKVVPVYFTLPILFRLK